MCQHALCEHGKSAALMPQPPSLGRSVRNWTIATIVVVTLLALPICGVYRTFAPHQVR